MQVELNYGRGQMAVELPEDCEVTVISKPAMPVLDNPSTAMARALANPVSAPPISELAAQASTACILICDLTRPVPNGVILPVLIRELMAGGIAAENITVLVATGLHRPNEGEELVELIGDPWVLETVRVVNHFAREDDDHVHVGTTTKGNVVRLDKRFVDADLKIATGLVEPHFMAGYSGGRKVIAPGVAHAETITTFHSARYMEHPLSANLVLEGNPLHEDQLEVVEMIGGAFAINAVIDEQRQVSFLNFGEIIESHLAAVEFTREYAEVAVPRQFSTVLTSSAGYPLDQTYYQTVKGMVGPLDILAEGGDLIIVSNCAEGMGSPEFVEAQRRLIELGPEGFLAAINAKTHADIDEWQTEMQLKPMRIGSIYLYSQALGELDWPLTGVNRVADIDRCLADSLARSPDRSLAVIPEGPYVIPVHERAA